MFKRLIGTTTQSFRRLAHTLPELPYDYNALAPVVSAEIMRLHHSKHHAAYVTNYNAAEEKLKNAVSKGDIPQIIGLQRILKFNGGGHINHSIFWTNLSPKGGGTPKGDVMEAIRDKYSSFDEFKTLFSQEAIGIQGSGWCWLGYDPDTNHVDVTTTSDQDPLQPTTGLVPLLGIDMWEHAYYLQYKNVRPDYVKAIWNVINWDNVEERYHNAKMMYS